MVVDKEMVPFNDVIINFSVNSPSLDVLVDYDSSVNRTVSIEPDLLNKDITGICSEYNVLASETENNSTLVNNAIRTVGSPELSISHIDGVPHCAQELKPVVGMKFATLAEGLEFYRQYAIVCGFGTRLEGEKRSKKIMERKGESVVGVVLNKRIVCNKEGKSKQEATVRRTATTRVSCEAKVDFKRVAETGEYIVVRFIEIHNHAMVTPNTMVHLKPARNLNMVHQKMIIDNGCVNIGPVKTFRSFKQYVRGYNNIGASMEDFKNFSRDVKHFIKEYDAQMIIETFMQKKAMCPSFYFDFEVDDDHNLTRLFWADPIGIKNYALFGDTVSFDTTFEYNRYCMVFAPFTGIDNHRRCVTFAAGFINKEDGEAFKWLFDNFVSAMNGCYPFTLITDQCLGIKFGFDKVFAGKTKHRYCMWHIMKKINEKVGPTICRETDFLKEINAVVWGDDIDIDEFESRWKSVLDKFGLSDNEWLKQMFEIRDLWIPSYFRDTTMGGIMRTTSWSESQNGFFGNFTNPQISLVEFWMRYQSAMDAQRWKHSKLTADSKTTKPNIDTEHPMENQASEFYTRTVFYEVYEELKSGCFSCGVDDIVKEDNIQHITVVDHRSKKSYIIDCTENMFSCSCKRFQMVGMLCRHVLCVLTNKGFTEIPSQYLLDRWGKIPTCRPIFNLGGTSLLADCKSIDTRQNNIGELWSEVFLSVSLVENDEERTEELHGILHSYNEKLLLANAGKRSAKNKKAQIEILLGTKIPNEAIILPPKQSKNKGSGKRMLSDKEKAIQESNKTVRKCSGCGQMATHDFRNCDKKKTKDPPAPPSPIAKRTRKGLSMA